MTASPPDWLTVVPGAAPLLVSLPHTGTFIPDDVAGRLLSLPLARLDTDWWIDRLYDFCAELGATIVHTAISRTVIDVNRDPAGVSLYPGQATTGLCPVTTFDGRLLYRPGLEPDAPEIARRRSIYFDPYHAALAGQIARLRQTHARIVLYDGHSIRSVIPRLFEGELPVFNIGTNEGRSCAPALQALAESVCDASGFSRVSNGRFKGGSITRAFGRPEAGVHAFQMELACRGYMDEADGIDPAPYDPTRAAKIRGILQRLLLSFKDWAG